jgi:hypothetical protein
MFFLSLAALTIPFGSCITQNAAGRSDNALIDTCLYYHLDVDYDSIPDELSLRYQGASIISPITWTFEIKSLNKTIFKITRNDKKLDEFFSDTLYVDDCSSYTECKRKFYFEMLPEMIFQRKIVPEKIDYPGLQPALVPFLTDSLKLNPEMKMKVLDEFKGRIESGRIVIIPVVLSPAINDHPVTYSTTLKRMITLLWG